MNSELRGEFDKLAADYEQMKADLRNVLEEEVENVQKQLTRSEKIEQEEEESQPIVEVKKQLPEVREDVLLISKDAYRLLFAETRIQLKNEAGLIAELRRQNAMQREVIHEFVHFLNDPEIENESINSVLAELLPEIESVRKEKSVLLKNNESMLEQLEHLKRQLEDRNSELKQCATMGEENANLKNALSMGSKEI